MKDIYLKTSLRAASSIDHYNFFLDEMEKEFAEYEEKTLGFLIFLNDLQVDNRIKFHGIKFRTNNDPGTPRDLTIQIMYREEMGIIGRTVGQGCIEYVSFKEDGTLSSVHNIDKNGHRYFPCQTFRSMYGWFKSADSYEITSKGENPFSP
jgi:hypothetical protein